MITALAVLWFSAAFVHAVPSPQRFFLGIKNFFSATPSRLKDSFRIVICWLENDWSGEETRRVEDAFAGVAGITLIVSEKKISARGAADEWRPAMQQNALAELERWNADVVIAGAVKKSGEALALWFVPRFGRGTLDRADRHYTLELGTLGTDFQEDIEAQLVAMAWTQLASLADTKSRGHVSKKGLLTGIEKLYRLLGTPTIARLEHRFFCMSPSEMPCRHLVSRSPARNASNRPLSLTPKHLL